MELSWWWGDGQWTSKQITRGIGPTRLAEKTGPAWPGPWLPFQPRPLLLPISCLVPWDCCHSSRFPPKPHCDPPVSCHSCCSLCQKGCPPFFSFKAPRQHHLLSDTCSSGMLSSLPTSWSPQPTTSITPLPRGLTSVSPWRLSSTRNQDLVLTIWMPGVSPFLLTSVWRSHLYVGPWRRIQEPLFTHSFLKPGDFVGSSFPLFCLFRLFPLLLFKSQKFFPLFLLLGITLQEQF